MKTPQQGILEYRHASAVCVAKSAIVSGTAKAELLRKARKYEQNACKIEARLGLLAKSRALAARREWQGLFVSVETAAGTYRHWYDPHNDTYGSTLMLYDYGYLRGTEGVDGDHVDVFLGPNAESAAFVFIVRQMKAPDFTTYDEDKVMIGFDNLDEAQSAYKLHYSDERFMGKVDAVPVAEFVIWAQNKGEGKAPVSEVFKSLGANALGFLRKWIEP